MLAGVLAFLAGRFFVFVLMFVFLFMRHRFVRSKIRRTTKHIQDIRVIFFALFWRSALQGSSFLASVKLRFTSRTDSLTSRFGPGQVCARVPYNSPLLPCVPSCLSLLLLILICREQEQDHDQEQEIEEKPIA